MVGYGLSQDRSFLAIKLFFGQSAFVEQLFELAELVYFCLGGVGLSCLGCWPDSGIGLARGRSVGRRGIVRRRGVYETGFRSTITVVLLSAERAQMREPTQPITVQPRRKFRAKMPPVLPCLRMMAMIVGRK